VIEVSDLVKLVKACRASGVSNLKYGDLELKFVTGEAEQAPISPSEVDKIPSAEELKVEQEQSALQENADDADDQLAFMAVEDPIQFEQLLVEREFINGGSNDNIIEVENRRIEQAVLGG
jgi:hypothetical protein